jgi:hypothetical protein
MRTGKLKGKTKIMIPYFDTEGNRHYVMLTVEGDMYASKMYAGIREFVRDNFKIEVDKDWLYHVPLIVNEHDPEVQVTEDERDRLIEEFIQRMELKDDEAESFTDTGDQSQDASQAGEQVCAVPDQSSTSGN